MQYFKILTVKAMAAKTAITEIKTQEIDGSACSAQVILFQDVSLLVLVSHQKLLNAVIILQYPKILFHHTRPKFIY